MVPMVQQGMAQGTAEKQYSKVWCITALHRTAFAARYETVRHGTVILYRYVACLVMFFLHAKGLLFASASTVLVDMAAAH